MNGEGEVCLDPLPLNMAATSDANLNAPQIRSLGACWFLLALVYVIKRPIVTFWLDVQTMIVFLPRDTAKETGLCQHNVSHGI